MAALGKPLVIVLINGRPLSVVNANAKANALVEGWYLGQNTGTAMADILFGDANPGGHLPVTIPRSVGQLPMFYNYKPSAHRGYLFDTTAPLFPFAGASPIRVSISPRRALDGHDQAGRFRHGIGRREEHRRPRRRRGRAALSPPAGSPPSRGRSRSSRASSASRSRPAKSKTLTFNPSARTNCALYNQAMQRVVEPGAFDVMVGGNSQDLKTAVLTVAG